MKKLLSAAFAAAIAVMPALSAFTAYAESYSPLVYFKAQSGFYADSDGNILIDIDELSSTDEGILVGVDVYIEDDSLNCWAVSPKWKSDSEYVKLNKLCNPLKDDPDAPGEYAYAETDETGKLIVYRHSVINSIDENYNTMNYTCMKMPAMIGGVMEDSPMVPYGKKSDDYPLTSFDMIVSPDTPAGDYEIFFLTEPLDYPDQQVTKVSACRTETESSRDFVPRTQSIHVIVTDSSSIPTYSLGDINNDGAVDATDASSVLAAYALESTGSSHGLNRQQIDAADINKDGSIDASDSSSILQFYSYSSTGGDLGFEDYLAQTE